MAVRWPANSLPANNHALRPIAIGRSNWLFAGSLRAGQRAAAVMSLVQSARMNGHDPYAYLKDDAAAHAQGKPGARIAAASLARCERLIDSRLAGYVNMGLPCAYS